MNLGLEKLIEATAAVAELSKDLAVKEKDLAVASQKADLVSGRAFTRAMLVMLVMIVKTYICIYAAHLEMKTYSCYVDQLSSPLSNDVSPSVKNPFSRVFRLR